jgi:carbamoyltransferase
MKRRGVPSQVIDLENHQGLATDDKGERTPPCGTSPCDDNRVAQFPFAHLDELGFRRLREQLKSIGYAEATISKRLRIWHVVAIALTQYPVYQARLRQRPDALSTVISLLLIQDPVPREEADDALTHDVVDDLLAIGILIPADAGMVVATVSVYPCAGFYFVTDHRFWPVSHQHYNATPQPVMYIGEDSYALAYLAPKVGGHGRVLDLCTGSGIQAILASRQARRVIGVDINERAVAFARFNASLNGVAARCDFRLGNLYQAVDGSNLDKADRRFDLILANPPFVPSPHAGEERLLFRDGGPAGDEILSRILEGLLAHLAARGMAAIVSLFVDQKRSSFKTRIKRWTGSRSKVNLLLLRFFSAAPEEFASWHTWQAFGDNFEAYSRRYNQWLDTLRAAQITQVTSGILAIRAGDEPRQRLRIVDTLLPARPRPNTIKRELDG